MIESLSRRALSGSSGTYHVHAIELAAARERKLKGFSVTVLFLDDTEHTFNVEKRAKGVALLDQVYQHLELVEKDYFGVQYSENGCSPNSNKPECMRWLDPSKSIKKQLGNCQYPLYFRVKFYVSDPSKLQEEYTRYQFYLQVRRDILEERLHLPPSTACLLASYTVQSELGDYQPDEHGPDYLSNLQLVPGQSEDMEKKISELHKLHKGQLPADAEFNFLDHAKRIEMYGVELHKAKMPENLILSGYSVMAESEPDLSTFENKSGLAEDMKFLASMPELCDVTFLVGDTREPVCAVKAVLAARSRVFHKMLYQAPSPQRKKEPAPRENKLRLFLKRSSEPLLNLQNASQQPTSHQHQTLIIEEFEPDVFRQLIEYIHTGCVTLQPRTLLGVMNAADYYGLDELRRACAGFVQCCINVDTVCALLASAERYIQYKCTKSLVQKVLEFVDEHGNEVLNLGSFTLLPQHVVRLILVRDELHADEFTKFQAALMWSKKYCDNNSNTPLKDVIGNFLEYIQFHKIPANVLMREVHPLGIVPYSIIMNALAYQADPASVDPGKLSPNRVRRHAQGRSMSVQSSLDPYGSNTTLSSSGSSELVSSDGKHSSN